MKTGSLSHKLSRATRLLKVTCKRFLCKPQLFCYFSQIQDSRGDLLLAHFELHAKIFDGPFQLSLTNHIRLLQLIGYQVKVETTQQQTPDGVLGYLSCYCGGKLEFQEELRIQSEVIEKKSIAFQRIYQSSSLKSEVDSENRDYSYYFTI